jgi:hypothetical protein
LFVGSLKGSAVAIQVKTMRSARRHGFYEWRGNPTKLKEGFYAFVDLKQKRKQEYLSELPDIFIVPVAVVRRWKHFPPKDSFVKPREGELLQYKNQKGWKALLRRLR